LSLSSAASGQPLRLRRKRNDRRRCQPHRRRLWLRGVAY